MVEELLNGTRPLAFTPTLAEAVAEAAVLIRPMEVPVVPLVRVVRAAVVVLLVASARLVVAAPPGRAALIHVATVV